MRQHRCTGRRFLLTWELGLNLGHLARLLPVTHQLQARGHTVLVAAREVRDAATYLGPAVSIVPAPHLEHGSLLPHPPASYADILLSQGWGDVQSLQGLVKSWLTLFDLFQPDALLTNFSPTALLAARIAGLPVVSVGNGFESPPLSTPLPNFPGFSFATPEQASLSDARALALANEVLRSHGMPPASALFELLSQGLRLFASFPELDHYGNRTDAQYIGPLPSPIGQVKAEWPVVNLPTRVFCYLRPDTPNVEAILACLRSSQMSILCVVPGFSKSTLERFAAPNINFFRQPVNLTSIVGNTDACITYGAEGTTIPFLLAGVPQLMAPRHIEAQLTARRIEELGIGLVLRGPQTEQSIQILLSRLISDPHYRIHARMFAERHYKHNPEDAVTTVIDALDSAFSNLAAA